MDVPEYRVKAAFIYNFVAFTQWPTEVGKTLNLCIVGANPFGEEINALVGKKVDERAIAVLRKTPSDPLKDCQIVFISDTAQVSRVLGAVQGHSALTVADVPGAMQQGVAVNMNSVSGRVTFEVNLKAARSAGLDLSSRLLRLATDVAQ